MGVAEPAIAAFEQDLALADFGEIGDQRLAIVFEDLGADRDLEDDVGAIGAGAVLAHAMGAGAGLEMLLVAVVDQRVEPIDTFDDHVSAPSAIAAIGAAEFDEFLAPERDGTRPASARADIDLGLVEEFHSFSSAL